MPADRTKSGFFYAVKVGKTVGVFRDWAECELSVRGYPRARYKKFSTYEEAHWFAFDAPPIPSEKLQPTPLSLPVQPVPQILDANQSEWDVAYTAGTCTGLDKSDYRAGIGIWWGPHDKRNLAERWAGRQSRKRAELLAILRLLETTEIKRKPLLIRSDSQYVIDCFQTRKSRWAENNWLTNKGRPVKYAGIIRCILKYLEARSNFGQKVVIAYIHRQKGHVGNDSARELANQGTLLSSARNEHDWVALEEILECQLNRTLIGLGREVRDTEILGPDDISDTMLTEIRTRAQKIVLYSSSGTLN